MWDAACGLVVVSHTHQAQAADFDPERPVSHETGTHRFRGRSLTSDRNHIGGAWTLLALANFKLDGLAVIQRCITSATFDFRVVYKKIFPPTFRSYKTETFICIEPLNCTFTHMTFYS